MSIEALSDAFLSTVREKRTGTFAVVHADELVSQIVLVQGYVADVDTGREVGVLEAALLDTELFTEKHIKKANKAAAKSGMGRGSALFALDLAPGELVAENVQTRIIEEVCACFQGDTADVGFVDHEEDQRVEGFHSEVSEHLEVYMDAEEIFLEAARRVDRWDLVERHFGILFDVYYATPNSMRFFEEAEKYPDEHAVVSVVDGVRDVEEVVNEAGIDKFLALRIVNRLVDANQLELINPVQMFQLGVDASSSDRLNKACRLFRRAHQRGLDDFDLKLKLAETYRALNNVPEATYWFVAFSEKCASQLRMEDAIRSLGSAVELNPENDALRRRYVELLIGSGQSEEAVEQVLALAAETESPTTAFELLVEVRDQVEDELPVTLQQRIVAVAEQLGDPEIAARERAVLVGLLEEQKDVEATLEVYQKMYCDGDDSVDVRLKLLDLHRKHGNRRKALEHAQTLLSLPAAKGVSDPETVIMLHEIVCELSPTDSRSNQWLAEHFLARGEKDRAVAQFRQWIGSLERENSLGEAEFVYQKLVSVDEDVEHRWGLASVLEKLGRTDEARRELRSLANIALRREEFDRAQKALDYVLKSSPFDLETRRTQVELLKAQGKDDLAAESSKEIALLDLAAGNVQEAEESCRQALALRPNDAEIVTKLGHLSRDSGDQRRAIEQYLKAAKIHFENLNFGLCRSAIDHLVALESGNSEATALLDKIEAKLNPPAPTPAPAAVSEPVVESFTGTKEAFASPSPVTTTVSKSMARLKRLKSGDGETSAPMVTASSGSPGGRTVTTKVGNITSKLRSLKGGDAPPASGASAGAAPPEPATNEALSSALKSLGGEGGDGVAKVKLGGAASRLAALRAGGGESQSAPPPAASADGEDSAPASGGDAESVKPMALGGAAGKLAALRAGGSPGGSPTTGESTEPASAGADGADGETTEPAANGASDAETTKTMALGGAAGRLAALRQTGGAAASPPTAGKDSDDENEPAPASEVTPGKSDAETVQPAMLGGAAGRLAALRAGGDTSTSASAASSGEDTPAASDDSGESAAPDTSGDDVASPEVAPTDESAAGGASDSETVKPMALGGAAGRLAALKASAASPDAGPDEDAEESEVVPELESAT